VTAIEVPEDVHIISALTPKRFVRDDPEPTRQIGSAWLKSSASAILRVPSIIVRAEFNYLLNPAHPDFHLIRFHRPRRFRFDPRLKT
jgi:RES domain-containing protein